MKYNIVVHEFSFNKIKNGSRKAAVHLHDKQCQRIKLNDVLEIENATSGEKLDCVVKGIAFFENFDDLVDCITPEKLGYDTKEEIMVRLNRIYSREQQNAFNAVAIYLAPQFGKVNVKFRDEMER